jgi:hypothetical protein
MRGRFFKTPVAKWAERVRRTEAYRLRAMARLARAQLTRGHPASLSFWGVDPGSIEYTGPFVGSIMGSVFFSNTRIYVPDRRPRRIRRLAQFGDRGNIGKTSGRLITNVNIQNLPRDP